MLRQLLAISCLLFAMNIQAQNADIRIGQLINESNWFELKQELENISGDSISPFIRQLAAAMTHHYFNRPDSACIAFSDLINEYQQELGDQTVNMLVMLSMDMARACNYTDAAGLMQTLADQLSGIGIDSTQLAPYRIQARQYLALASCSPVCQAIHGAGEYHFPMIIEDNGGQHSIEMNGSINGIDGRLLFDTGAGGNMITPDLAKKYGLRFLCTDITVGGYGGLKQGTYAVADTLRIGEMAWINVPFAVVDIRTGHEEADKLAEDFELPPVVGLPVMLSMKEIQLDFAHGEFIVPARPDPNPLPASNMLRTETEGLLVKSSDKAGQPLYLHFDTGTYFSVMQPSWYARHQKEVDATGMADSLRMAGVGGVSITRAYRLPELELRIGNGTVTLESVDVNTGVDLHTGQVKTSGISSGDEDGVLGLNALEEFSKVIINFKDMYLEAIPYPKDH